LANATEQGSFGQDAVRMSAVPSHGCDLEGKFAVLARDIVYSQVVITVGIAEAIAEPPVRDELAQDGRDGLRGGMGLVFQVFLDDLVGCRPGTNSDFEFIKVNEVFVGPDGRLNSGQNSCPFVIHYCAQAEETVVEVNGRSDEFMRNSIGELRINPFPPGDDAVYQPGGNLEFKGLGLLHVVVECTCKLGDVITDILLVFAGYVFRAIPRGDVGNREITYQDDYEQW